MGCISQLATVRGALPEYDAADIDVLLLNIHETPGSELLDRFAFRSTPTYIFYDSDGEEKLRSSSVPEVDALIASLE